MNNWDIICKVKATVPDNEDGWRVMDDVWKVLDGLRDGLITREEGAAELTGLVEDPGALLEEVGA